MSGLRRSSTEAGQLTWSGGMCGQTRWFSTEIEGVEYVVIEEHSGNWRVRIGLPGDVSHERWGGNFGRWEHARGKSRRRVTWRTREAAMRAVERGEHAVSAAALQDAKDDEIERTWANG